MAFSWKPETAARGRISDTSPGNLDPMIMQQGLNMKLGVPPRWQERHVNMFTEHPMVKGFRKIQASREHPLVKSQELLEYLNNHMM